MIVVEVIVADNSLLPRHEEISIVLHLKIIKKRKVEIHEKARRCLIAIDDVQCTLELGHVDKNALLIATIEPRKFIDTISFNSFLLVERQRSIIVQECSVVGRLLHFLLGVYWAILHELVVFDFQMTDLLYEQG